MSTSVSLAAVAVQQFFDDNGNPLAGGTVTPMVGGIPYPTYSDPAGTVPLPNPIVLNSRGEIATAAGASTPWYVASGVSYTFLLQDALGNTIESPGNIIAPLSPTAVLDDVTGEFVGQQLWPQTTAEAAASITPADYSFPPCDVQRYGADPTGATSSSIAINSAFLAAAKTSGAFVTFSAPGSYRCDAGLTWDPATTGIEGNGAVLSFAAMTSGVALTPVSSETNPNLQPMRHAIHPVRNLRLIGGGATVPTTALQITDTSGVTALDGMLFEGVTFQDWQNEITVGAGAYENTFRHCLFTITAGTYTLYGLHSNAGVNSGERWVFDDCAWYNRPNVIANSNPNCDMFFTNCSIDGATIAFLITGGNIFWNGGHLEFGTDTADSIQVSGAGSFFGSNFEIVDDAARVNSSWFNSASNVTNTGVFLDNVFWSAGSGATSAVTYLVDGTGNARVRNINFFNAGAKPPFAAAANLAAYGTFENTNYQYEWSLTGTTPPAASNAQNHTPGGAYSLQFAGTASNLPVATFTRACKPGEVAVGDIWYLAPNLAGSGGTFSVSLLYLDGGGRTLSGAAVVNVVNANVSTWTNEKMSLTLPAPPGTASVQVYAQVSGVTSGAPLCYIDDFLLNVA
jgi:hypothetical protein